MELGVVLRDDGGDDAAVIACELEEHLTQLVPKRKDPIALRLACESCSASSVVNLHSREDGRDIVNESGFRVDLAILELIEPIRRAFHFRRFTRIAHTGDGCHSGIESSGG